jgi:3-hydroxyisobutyrate dehydrogenase-like beta-hydroxyacid dehydrogenase
MDSCTPKRFVSQERDNDVWNSRAQTVCEARNFYENILLGWKCYTDEKQGVNMSKIGILHPGEMGISIAACAINNGHQVYWLSQGRGDKTRTRAEKYDLIEIGSLSEFCQICEIVISICPPHAAEAVAQSVIEAGFKGLYMDANAIAPQRVIKIGQMMKANKIQFIDGSIIGGPVWIPKGTWLYLSGERAEEIAACFSNGPLETKIIGSEIGKASALKMCYAAYTKGTTALLAAILAAAESLHVREELYQQWNLDEEGFSEQVNRRVRRVTAKAWRFEGEMKEIATTLREAGLPDGFHQSAAEMYHRMANLKDAAETPLLNDVLKALLLH